MPRVGESREQVSRVSQGLGWSWWSFLLLLPAPALSQGRGPAVACSVIRCWVWRLQQHLFDWASQVALVVKKLPANAGDIGEAGLIPGSGRTPGGGPGNPLQYSCLENPTDRGAWQVRPQGREELDMAAAAWHVPCDSVCVCVRDGHRERSGHLGEEVSAAPWRPAVASKPHSFLCLCSPLWK